MKKLIEIGGAKRPVSLGRNALIEFETLTKQKLLIDGSGVFDTHESIRAFLYSALKWGLYEPLKGVEPVPDFTIFQVGDWLTENPDAFAQCIAALGESLPPLEKNQQPPQPEGV